MILPILLAFIAGFIAQVFEQKERKKWRKAMK